MGKRFGFFGASPARLGGLRGAAWGGCPGEVAIMGEHQCMYLLLPCFWLVLVASRLGPVKGRRDEGHPTARRQDRLEPGIRFPWKLRAKG